MNNKLKNNKKLIKIMVNSLKIGMEEDETRASVYRWISLKSFIK